MQRVDRFTIVTLVALLTCIGEALAGGELAQPQPNAKPIVTTKRLVSAYSARSKLNEENTLDGIGVVDNWSKVLGAKTLGTPAAVAILAFPEEPVAYGTHRGFTLRLVNRTPKPVAFAAVDSRLYIVQEALDEKGKWREIEEPPSSRCGNSYHNVHLEAGRYWEFSAPAYTGSFKTKLRFRLNFTNHGESTYSNVFEGQIAKEQILKGPSRREIYRALHCKDLKEEGVLDTLMAIVRGEATDAGSHYPPHEAADHLAKFGPAAKDALPALRVAARSGDIELSGSAAYARWRIDGNLDECIKSLLALLVEGGGTDIEQMHLIALLWSIGPQAKDAVPVLCRMANTPADSYRQEYAVRALGFIRSRSDIAVPALMREMEKPRSPVREEAMEAVAEFGADAKPAIPHLVAALKDESDHIKRAAAISLWRIERNAERVLPVFMEQLKLQNRNGAHYAAEWLGEIGPAAKAAVPQLTLDLKREDDQPLRFRAAGALWRITNQVEPSLTVLCGEFRSKESLLRSDVEYGLRILQEMGPHARNALPALRAAVHAGQDEDVQELLEKAIRKLEAGKAK